MLIKIGNCQTRDSNTQPKKWNSKSVGGIASHHPKPSHLKKNTHEQPKRSDVSKRLARACMTFCGVCKFGMAPRTRGNLLRMVCVNKHCVGQDARSNKQLRTSKIINVDRGRLLHRHTSLYNLLDQQDNNPSTTKHELETCKTDMTIPIIRIKCKSISCSSEQCYRPSRAATSNSSYKMRYICSKCEHSFVA